MNGFYWAILVLGFGSLCINLMTYKAFAADKRFAEIGAWRISEANLLTLAFCGGSVGAKLAQRKFRHKTRKQPFASLLNLILAAHIVLLASLTFLDQWVPFLEWFGTQLEVLFTHRSGSGGSESRPKRFGPGS